MNWSEGVQYLTEVKQTILNDIEKVEEAKKTALQNNDLKRLSYLEVVLDSKRKELKLLEF